jgi:hypothetical protein
MAAESNGHHFRSIHEDWLQFLDLPFRLADLVKSANVNDPAVGELIDELLNNYEEDFHANVETDLSGYLASLQRHDVSFLERSDDFIKFVYALSVQAMRTSSMQEGVVAAVEALGLRFDRIWRVLRHILADNVGWVLYAERAAWRLVFLEASNARSFITGDQPLLNACAMECPVGQEPEHLEFYYPISPKLAILLPRRTDVNHGVRLPLDAREIDRYNLYIAEKAREQIYSDSRELLERIAESLPAGSSLKT